MTSNNNITKVADLCDAHDSEVRILAPIFSDFGGNTSFNGIAVTVRCFEDNATLKALTQTAGNGRVLVVDGGASSRRALLGDMLGENMVKNGWSGAIIYGYIRDKAELAQLAIGVKALGAFPRRPEQKAEAIVGQAIEFAGQIINDGDHIYADADGVIILNLDN
ncbi:MAG: ribonuclease E activity regulator RraA [Enterobacteriaceae bacterium]|jgi:regulator of ribonuclease activity A|nr:ribonuclease E activity regulator RraA [Enterobacteriaceae bacterium]